MTFRTTICPGARYTAMTEVQSGLPHREIRCADQKGLAAQVRPVASAASAVLESSAVPVVQAASAARAAPAASADPADTVQVAASAAVARQGGGDAHAGPGAADRAGRAGGGNGDERGDCGLRSARIGR